MNNKFDRIVREPLVMGGQARIRDTNITVDEIVRLSLDGMSQSDILAKYPQLEAEDVHQAMAWAVNDLKEATGFWRNEILTPLVSVRSYSEPANYNLLKTSELVSSDSIIEIIHKNAIQGIARLQHFTGYHQIQYPIYMRDAAPISIHEIIDDSTENAQEINPSILVLKSFIGISLKTFVPDYGYLTRAFAYIMASEAWFFEETSKLIVTKIKDVVLIEIRRKYRYEDDPYQILTKLTDIGASSMVSVANLIIYQNGSELKVRQDGDSVIFEFELPIWQDKQD